MGQPTDLEHIEFDHEQIAAVLSFAAQHQMSPADVVRRTLDMYVVPTRGEGWLKERDATTAWRTSKGYVRMATFNRQGYNRWRDAVTPNMARPGAPSQLRPPAPNT